MDNIERHRGRQSQRERQRERWREREQDRLVKKNIYTYIHIYDI